MITAQVPLSPNDIYVSSGMLNTTKPNLGAPMTQSTPKMGEFVRQNVFPLCKFCVDRSTRLEDILDQKKQLALCFGPPSEHRTAL